MATRDQAGATRRFSQWYERELLAGHAHLVLLVLAALGALGAVEAHARAGSARALLVGSLLVCAAIGAWALRRYLFHLLRAEQVANQATCAACGRYGRFDVDRHFPAPPAQTVAGSARADLPGTVCCRGCGHRWHIDV